MKVRGVEEIGAIAVIGLEPLQLREVDLAAELDRVRTRRDRDVVLDQRLILVIVLGEVHRRRELESMRAIGSAELRECQSSAPSVGDRR